MKKLIPAKTLTLIQNLICLVMMIVITIFSCMNLFVVPVNMNEDVRNTMEETMAKLSDDGTVEIPETIEIGLPMVIKSVASTGEAVKAMMDAAKSIKDTTDKAKDFSSSMENADTDYQSPEDAQKSADEMQKQADDLSKGAEDAEAAAKNAFSKLTGALMNMILLIFMIIGGFKSGVIVGILYVGLLFTISVLPFYCIVRTIMVMVKFFTNLKDPDEGYHKISKTFGKTVCMFPIFLFYLLIIPGFKFTGTTRGIFVCLAIVLVLNTLIPRMKDFSKAENRYLNAVQIISVVSIGAFLLFFFNIAKAGLFDAMFDRLGVIVGQSKDFPILEVAVVTAICVLLFLTCKYLGRVACRLACMVKVTSNGKVKDSCISRVVMALIVIAGIFYLTISDFALKLTSAGSTAFYMAAVGAVLMLGCEIALQTVKKKLSATVTPEQMKAVMVGCPSGIADTEAAPAAEEAPAAEKAHAEEAPAEEETLDGEIPAEERVVAESVTEEASAEEEVAVEKSEEKAEAEETTAEEAVEEAVENTATEMTETEEIEKIEAEAETEAKAEEETEADAAKEEAPAEETAPEATEAEEAPAEESEPLEK